MGRETTRGEQVEQRLVWVATATLQAPSRLGSRRLLFSLHHGQRRVGEYMRNSPVNGKGSS